MKDVSNRAIAAIHISCLRDACAERDSHLLPSIASRVRRNHLNRPSSLHSTVWIVFASIEDADCVPRFPWPDSGDTAAAAAATQTRCPLTQPIMSPNMLHFCWECARSSFLQNEKVPAFTLRWPHFHQLCQLIYSFRLLFSMMRQRLSTTIM